MNKKHTEIWNIGMGAHVLQGIHIKGSHPMSCWNTEKRTSFMISLFASVQNVYLWFGARYGFDSFTLIVYTSLHASSNAVELARQHKIGEKKGTYFKRYVHYGDIKYFRSESLRVLGPVPRYHNNHKCPCPHNEGILHLLLPRGIWRLPMAEGAVRGSLLRPPIRLSLQFIHVSLCANRQMW